MQTILFGFGVLCLFETACVFGLPRHNHNINGYDQSFAYTCQPGRSFYYMHSHHRNEHQDRKYGYLCRPSPEIHRTRCRWTKYMNNFDERFYLLLTNATITGVGSYHSNVNEDRRFRFRYCYIRQGYALERCRKTGYVNYYDQDVAYIIPKGKILTGIYSVHSNVHEDRRWGYNICSVRNLHRSRHHGGRYRG